MKNKNMIPYLISAIVLAGTLSTRSYSQTAINRDTMMLAAQEIIRETNYCALVTIDSSGQPQIRTMNPFPANDDLITWFATSRTSRKVREIKDNPRVCVYYADHITAKGYVSITGTATVIDDRDLLLKMKRDYWEGIPGWQDKFVLIRIIPETLEVINYKHRLTNDPNTFRAPSVRLR
jgi:general stress protein 26